MLHITVLRVIYRNGIQIQSAAMEIDGNQKSEEPKFLALMIAVPTLAATIRIVHRTTICAWLSLTLWLIGFPTLA